MALPVNPGGLLPPHRHSPTPLRLLLLSTITLLAACVSPSEPGRGLRLPEGDPTRGREAFRSLGCERCHAVAGVPREEPRPEMTVNLGGTVSRVSSYGELVTAIVHPSHRLTDRYRTSQVSEAGASRMESLNEAMTVAQLIDLVTFLRARYETRVGPDYEP